MTSDAAVANAADRFVATLDNRPRDFGQNGFALRDHAIACWEAQEILKSAVYKWRKERDRLKP